MLIPKGSALQKGNKGATVGDLGSPVPPRLDARKPDFLCSEATREEITCNKPRSCLVGLLLAVHQSSKLLSATLQTNLLLGFVFT